MLDNKDFFIAAQFGKTFGVHGWISLRSFCELDISVFNYLPWHIINSNNELVELSLEKYASKNKLIAKIAGYATPEAVSILVNKEIYVSKKYLTANTTDQYYHIQLESLLVYNQQNELLGKVDSILATGANDVLCLVPTQNSVDNRKHLIPYIDTVIKEVDIEQKKIIVQWDKDFL